MESLQCLVDGTSSFASRPLGNEGEEVTSFLALQLLVRRLGMPVDDKAVLLSISSA